jgi:general stress protein 26
VTEFASYEEVSIYGLDDSNREKLLSTHNECTFMWSTQEGWPIGVIMSYLWAKDRFWLTAGAHRHRISAVRRDPRVSITVTSTGSALGPGKSITAKGRCVVHEDRETKDWFYPDFSAHLYGDAAAAEDFCKFLDSPLRVVLEVVPEKWIGYDGVKMFLDQAGKLEEKDKTPRQSADMERLPREIKRRGLA